MTRKRSRHVSSRPSTSNQDTSNEKWFTFRNPDHKLKFNRICNFEILPTKFLDMDILAKYGLADRVKRLIQNVGWERVAEIRCPAFRKPILTFLSTCKYTEMTSEGDEPKVTFQMFRMTWRMTLTEFNIRLGFETVETVKTTRYQIGLLEPCAEFMEDGAFWDSITGGRGEPCNQGKKKKLSSDITNMPLRIIHTWLTRSVMGRYSTSVLPSELFILWCMVRARPLNAGYWFLKTCLDIERKRYKRSIVVGSFITRLATRFGSLQAVPPDICSMKRIDTNLLVAIGILVRDPRGELGELRVSVDEGGAAAEEEELLAEEPAQQHIPHVAEEPAQEHIRHVDDHLNSHNENLQQQMSLMQQQMSLMQQQMMQMMQMMQRHLDA